MGKNPAVPAGAHMSVPFSITWLPFLGGSGLVLILVGIHLIYYLRVFHGDTRFDIQLAFVPDRSAEYFRHLHERIARHVDNRTGSNTIVELDCTTEPDGRFAIIVTEMPLRMGSIDQSARLAVTSWSNVRLDGNVRAPYVFAKEIYGDQCERIDIGVIVAADNCELSAANLSSNSMSFGTRGRLCVQELFVTKMSSPDLRIETIESWRSTRDKPPRQPPVPRARKRFMEPVVVKKALRVPEGSTIQRAVIAYSNVEICDRVVIEESLKVYGDLKIGNNVDLHGPVVINGNLEIGENCTFWSDVVTKGNLIVGKDVQFGCPRETLVTVIARQIRIGGASRLAGTMLSSIPLGIRNG